MCSLSVLVCDTNGVEVRHARPDEKFGLISVIGLNMEINSVDNCSLASLLLQEWLVMSGCLFCAVVVVDPEFDDLGKWSYSGIGMMS